MSNCGYVVHTVTLEKIRFTENNRISQYPNPISLSGKKYGHTLILLNNVGIGLNKYQACLHYLVDQIEMIVRIDKCTF